MTKTTITNDMLREYIKSELLNDPAIAINDDQDLLLSGLLDSLNVFRLASHIEQSCAISIPPEDMILEHFGTLNQISAYVQTRT